MTVHKEPTVHELVAEDCDCPEKIMTVRETVGGRWCAALAGALLLVLAWAAAADDLDQAKRELDEITDRLNALGRWFTTAERQQRTWQREIRATDTRISDVQDELRQLEERGRAIELEIAELAEQRGELEQRRDEQADQVAHHLSAAYRLAGEDFFKLVLNQQDPAQLARMMRYHRYFSESRLDTLRAFQQTMAELAANEARREERRRALQAQQSTLERTRQGLESERRERQQLLAKLAEDAEHKSKEQERLTADRDRLEQLIAELSRRHQVPDGAAFAESKGRLPWPANGALAHRFGDERSGGRLRWQGIFIGADAGTAVRAVHPGRVAFADWLRGFGLLTILDHGGGHMSLYAHADALLKNVGDWVEGGETIAQAGSSGGRSENGVYFEIRIDGSPSDPLTWLSRR